MRWHWFLLVVLVGALVPIGYGLWAFVVSPIDPGYGGCPDPIFEQQVRIAEDLGARMNGALIVTMLVAGFLVFESYYFQLMHGSQVIVGTLSRFALGMIVAAGLGLGIQYLALRWGFSDPTTCMYSALMNYEASRHVPFGGEWVPIPWTTMMRLEFVAASLVGGLAGTGFYSALRKSLRI